MEGDSFAAVSRLAAASKAILGELLCGFGKGLRAEFDDALCRYVQCRYMLKAVPSLSDSLYTLSELSIAQMSGMPKDVVALLERESGCTGAKSAMIKKVMLILSLMRGLSLCVDEDSAAKVDTVGQLGDLCWEKMKEK